MAATATARFAATVSARAGAQVIDYRSLHAWSVRDSEGFWAAVWDQFGVVAEARGDRVVQHPGRMPGTRFFPEARLNFADNLLRRKGSGDAIVFRGEDRFERRLTWQQLATQVVAAADVLRAHGVGAGDRVAAFLPNLPEAVVGMLATASLGAVWSSCSPDFGVEGVVDRFAQIEPRVLFAADGYLYKGRVFDSLDRTRRIAERLPTLRQVLVVPYVSGHPDIRGIPGASLLALDDAEPDARPTGEAVGFNDPLYVLFSSGTTGKPKCIVHGVGGTLLKHLVEHRLMCDVRAGDRVFYFTTCGWMMWNWLASALASEATLLLYDGHPMWPDPGVLWRFAAEEQCTLFGTSAKYLDALRKAGVSPRTEVDLGALRTITSTGSPLVPEGFDYVYQHVHDDVCLSSISGGTDIVGCFVGGDPTGPVWRGEIQAPTVGMAIDVFDDRGNPVRGGRGELVCTRPFPSMPLGFWGDNDGSRYRAAYFERYPGVWHHGDFAEFTPHGGLIIHGRSDATLNPGGVRIGNAEIYRVVEAVADVEEALVVGQEHDDDVRIVLFVKLRPGLDLDDDRIARLRSTIRERCSPRHVPAIILQVSDIPRTRSGKIVELAVRDLIHGREPRNLTALANPEALDEFRDRPELADSNARSR